MSDTNSSRAEIHGMAPAASSSGVDKLRPFDDPRFTHEYATLNGRRYHYLLALPEGGRYARTVFLIHGWPDLSLGWRYQVPMFLSMGCRVVCPDLMGFGRTEAPTVPPSSQNIYGFRRAADDIAELARQLGAGRIILGGHDWGGAVAYRVALWHASLISHLFVVCTPYLAPKPASETFVPLPELVRTRLPFWQYQLQLGSEERVVEQKITRREHFESFLRGMYGGTGKNGETIFDVYKGVLFENLGKIGPSPLMDEDETRYYTDEYHRNGMQGNVNWYKTHEANYRDELGTVPRSTIEVPTLFIQATRDAALPPALGASMEQSIPKLKRAEVDGSHWVLWQKPAECNALITEWIEENKALAEKSSL